MRTLRFCFSWMFWVALAIAPAFALTPIQVGLPQRIQHPALAATPQELARLRGAWKSKGPEHEVTRESGRDVVNIGADQRVSAKRESKN